MVELGHGGRRGRRSRRRLLDVPEPCFAPDAIVYILNVLLGLEGVKAHVDHDPGALAVTGGSGLAGVVMVMVPSSK